jgi:hypothetical protein
VHAHGFHTKIVTRDPDDHVRSDLNGLKIWRHLYQSCRDAAG